MKSKLLSFLFFAISCFFNLSCSDTPEPTPPTTVEIKKPDVFPFYKNIEIKPGLNFEIISWGKGIDSLGGIAVLLSDSTHKNFNAVTKNRKGILTDAWNLDLDTDGNPELYLQVTQNKNQSDLLVFEYDDGAFRKISFPALSDRTKKIFLGNDKFFIKNGHLMRTIPVKGEKEGEKVNLVVDYLMRGNAFDIKEVKE